MEAFLQSLSSEKKDATLTSYRRDLSKLCRYASPRTLGDLKKTDLVSYFDHLSQHLSPSSFSRAVCVVRRYYRFLEQQGKKDNPMEGIRASFFRKKECPSLSEEDFSLLLDAPSSGLGGKRDETMIALLCCTGMRVSELVCMDRSDVCLERSSVVCGEGDRRREIFVPSHVLSLLETCIALSSLRAPDEKALFIGSTGKRITRQGFWKNLKDRAQRLGLGECSPQTLRSSLAKHLLLRGQSRPQVRHLLGNRSDSGLREYEKMKKDQ